MNYTIKLNNVKPNDITFSSGTENIIYSKNITEEISGLISVDIGNDSIFCEKVQDNYVKANLSVDGDYFDSVYFKVIRGKDAVVLSKNYTKYKPPGIVREESELAHFLKTNVQNNVSQKTDKIVDSLRREVHNLKREVNRSRQLVVEKTEPLERDNDSYKASLLNEHLSFIETQKRIVKESIKTIYVECVDTLTEQLTHKQGILVKNLSNKIKQLEANLLAKYEKEKAIQESVLTERVDEYSTYIRNFVRDTVKTAQNSYDEIFNKKFKEQEQIFLENSVTAFSDFKETLKQEFKEVAVGEVSALFREKDGSLNSVLSETVNAFNKDLDTKIDSKYSDMNLLFDSYVGDIKSKIQIVEDHIQEIDTKTKNTINKKEQEIEEHVNTFISSSNERIAQVNEKFKEADLKISSVVSEIKSSIEEVKSYTSTESFQRFIIENSTLELRKLKEALNEEFKRTNLDEAAKIISENNRNINDIIDNKVKEISDDLDQSLGERIRNNVLFLENSLEPFNDKIRLVESKLENLENIATDILSEKNKELEKQISSYVLLAEEQQNLIQEKIKELDKKSKEIINEKRQVSKKFQQQIDSARMYTDSKVKAAVTEAMQYARKMLDFAGGGGTVAVQYAEGGNVRGPLQVDDLQIDSIDINTTSVRASNIYATDTIYVSGIPLDDIYLNQGSDRIDGGLIDF